MKHDLRDTTFTIPIRMDSRERFENMKLVLRFLDQHFETNLIILEAAQKRLMGPTSFEPFGMNCRYLYVEKDDDVFFRTKYLNLMAKAAQTPIVVNYDADVLFRPEQYLKAVNFIRRNEADLVIPYEAQSYHLTDEQRALLVAEGVLERISEAESEKWHSPSWGGAVFWNREKFFEAGMENENLISWGPEDSERIARATKLGYRMLRTKGPLFHLPHPRGKDSHYENPYWKANIAEYENIMNMDAATLRTYVDGWTWPYSQVRISEEDLIERVDG